MALCVDFKRQFNGLDSSLAEREVAGLTGVLQTFVAKLSSQNCRVRCRPPLTSMMMSIVASENRLSVCLATGYRVKRSTITIGCVT